MKFKNKSLLFVILLFILFVLMIIFFIKSYKTNIDNLSATVVYLDEEILILEDKNKIQYTFDIEDMDVGVGSQIVIKYKGILDKNEKLQACKILDYEILE